MLSHSRPVTYTRYSCGSGVSSNPKPKLKISIRPEHAELEHVSQKVMLSKVSSHCTSVSLHRRGRAPLALAEVLSDGAMILISILPKAATAGPFLGTPEKTRSPRHLLQKPGAHSCNIHVQSQSPDRCPACRATCLVHSCSRSNPHSPTNVTQTR